MDQYMPGTESDNYYSRSIPIVQSSGMGKSRLVDESAKTRFTFPLNLHENMGYFSGTYPPFDHSVRDYLTASLEEDSAKIRHYVFLEALFSEASDRLKDYQKGTPEEIALRWYEWMDYGSVAIEVGTNRTDFYNQVIRKARELEGMSFEKLRLEEPELEPYPSSITRIRRKRLLRAANMFLTSLQGLHTEAAQGFLAVIYFDEAHTLCKTEGDRDSSHSALMQVLNALVELPIFFIFLSTNYIIDTFDMPTTHYLPQKKLIPPYFELPFDCFSANFTAEAKAAGKLTLDGVCELGQVVKYGRPMWESYYQTLEEDSKIRTIVLAKLKMGDSSSKHARLAAVACRVLLPFDPLGFNASTVQAELIRSYMRVVYNIPEDRSYIWSGYSTEPILAEAAGLLLEGHARDAASHEDTAWLHKYTIAVPEILFQAHKDGVLDPGDLDGLVMRTLFTVAHDLVIAERYPESPRTTLRFHRPIRLLDLLENLCSDECWKIVKSATPREAVPGAPTLEDAFKDAWVSFSHFAQLGNYDTFNLKYFSELLKRGVAVRAFRGHPDWDGAIPIYFGSPATTPISHENTSALLMQDKNARMGTKVSSKLMALNKKDANELPVVSIVFDLGATEVEHTCVSIKTKLVDPDTAAGTASASFPVRRRHYMITLHGCTSRTYKCVPEEYPRIYDVFLRTHEPLDETDCDALCGLKHYTRNPPRPSFFF